MLEVSVPFEKLSEAMLLGQVDTLMGYRCGTPGAVGLYWDINTA